MALKALLSSARVRRSCPSRLGMKDEAVLLVGFSMKEELLLLAFSMFEVDLASLILMMA